MTLVIEMCGTGGTSLGKFTRKRDVAWVDFTGDDREIAIVTSIATHFPLTEVFMERGLVHEYDTGEYEGTAHTWEEMLTLSLGKPPYGYTWYRVKGQDRRFEPQQWRTARYGE